VSAVKRGIGRGLVLLSALFLTSAAIVPLAVAALSPGAERLREFEIVADEAARTLAEPIDGIQRLSEGRYLVSAGRCRVEVDLVPDDASGETARAPGPARTRAVAGKPSCGE
jgi:hypothetical protein